MSDADRTPISEQTRLESRDVLIVPMDDIKRRLRAENAVKEVKMCDSSDFVYGLQVDVTITDNCSFQLTKALRELGLYIEHVHSYNDHEVLHCRRIARLLERMENHGVNDRLADIDRRDE